MSTDDTKHGSWVGLPLSEAGFADRTLPGNGSSHAAVVRGMGTAVFGLDQVERGLPTIDELHTLSRKHNLFF